MTCYLVGYTAERPASQAAPPMAGHDDKINILGTSDIEDILGRRSITQQNPRPNPLPVQFTLHGFQVALSFLVSVLTWLLPTTATLRVSSSCR